MVLNCWVRGDSDCSTFSVEILSTKTVGALKEDIKNKNENEFRGVDPKDLTLYQVSLPYDEDGSLGGVLGDRTISSLEKPLQSFQKLSAVFNKPLLDDKLHLIVGMWHF